MEGKHGGRATTLAGWIVGPIKNKPVGNWPTGCALAQAALKTTLARAFRATNDLEKMDGDRAGE